MSTIPHQTERAEPQSPATASNNSLRFSCDTCHTTIFVSFEEDWAGQWHPEDFIWQHATLGTCNRLNDIHVDYHRLDFATRQTLCLIRDEKEAMENDNGHGAEQLDALLESVAPKVLDFQLVTECTGTDGSRHETSFGATSEGSGNASRATSESSGRTSPATSESSGRSSSATSECSGGDDAGKNEGDGGNSKGDECEQKCDDVDAEARFGARYEQREKRSY
ncbi:uncharacterized protein AB675_819 [Cyphellophora attinorum]|uniref:Uncharacterized protein n=1 Tax=Cyphellophora attinorum TaxID=1664694 RepID=A0A0N0NS18_9EURO|nr:uncharacterized protein AB675_819 [Phialophora attinorum]KPI45741.1 hypothetical protein AB675_819 [Phialophora attinorum]